MHFLLCYEVVPDYVTRRAAHREEHLRLARAAAARGELVLGGAFDPPVGTALLFRGASPAAAEAFAGADPYVRHGLVSSWRVRPWTTVVGAEAEVRVDDVGAPPRAEADATTARLASFLRTARNWSVASVGADGASQSAVVGVAVEDDLGLVFDTLAASRKAQNIRRDPRVSLVMWSGGATAQIEGRAELLDGDARTSAQRGYLVAFADGWERAGLPGTVYIRVRPSWVRITDFAGDAPTVVELSEAALQLR